MERFELPLSKLSFSQKLEIMECLWDDLSRNEKMITSPAWHEDILKDRDDALAAGKLTVSDWEEAKERIRRNTSCK